MNRLNLHLVDLTLYLALAFSAALMLLSVLLVVTKTLL